MFTCSLLACLFLVLVQYGTGEERERPLVGKAGGGRMGEREAGGGGRQPEEGCRARGVRGAREAPAGSNDVMRGVLRARRGEAYERWGCEGMAKGERGGRGNGAPEL